MKELSDYVSKQNLFGYATSELSQDAFICWLLSYAMEGGASKNAALHGCAVEFLRKVLPGAECIVVNAIRRQYMHTDVLVTVNHRWHIIIEDKTFTDVHGTQIQDYKAALQGEVPDGSIKTVFYKIVEQSGKEAVDFSYDRKTLLEVFGTYTEQTDNAIFLDYVAYLKALDTMVEQWRTTPIREWCPEMFGGFFTYLDETIFSPATGNWGYVSNANGGFMALWFKGYSAEALHISKDILEEVYLQIEDNIISLKILMAGNGRNSNHAEIRWQLYNEMKAILSEDYGETYRKKGFRPGRYVSAGYLEYDETNYADKIKHMEKALEKLVSRHCVS